MNKKMIYRSEGFTLIETIVSIALIASIMTALSFGVALSYREYKKSNAYKKESDIDLANIQEPYTTDSTTLKKSVDYTMKTTIDGKITALAMYNTTNTDPSISLSRFEAQASNFKASLSFKYLSVDTYSGKLTTIDELSDFKISSFEELPSTNYEALEKMNKDWGIWSYVGWSLVDLNNISWKSNEKTKTGIVMYKDSYTKKPLYCGNPNPAPLNSNYEGLITPDNFTTIQNMVENKQIDLSHYALVPAYLFSKDVYNSDADTKLLMNTIQTVRKPIDERNITSLANTAAKYIKSNGMNSITSDINSVTKKALCGNGLEILHFREGGWPVEAASVITNGSTLYYNYGTDWYNGSIYLKYGKDYENSFYYKKYPKIGDDPEYAKGFKKGEFLYDIFMNGIGYDLTKVGNPTSRDKNYNSLLFGDDLMLDNNQFQYSLFMKINENSKTVTVWVNRVASDGSSDSSGIDAFYSATASYA